MFEKILKMAEAHREKMGRVEGTTGKRRDIFLFTLSTCMWCKMGKKWLKERGYAYTFLDVDTIPVDEKNRLKEDTGKLTGVQVRYPFLVTSEDKWHSGYDTTAWEEILGEKK